MFHPDTTIDGKHILDPHSIENSFFSILGATAVLSGATRMTFALAVVMLETTASVDLFLPIIFTLFISYGTGAILINKSVYLSAIRAKNIPLLGKSAPSLNRSLAGFNIMHSPVVSCPFILKVEKAFEMLQRTEHSGFPVVNGFDRPIGIIERDVLITMIDNEAWYYRE
jgi:CBS domain-containing protein